MSHPLDGCTAKLARANDHIKNISDHIVTKWKDDIPQNSIRGQIQVKVTPSPDGEYATALKGIRFFLVGTPKRVPYPASIFAGEAVHQFRSILDHLVYQLVVAKTGNPPRFNSAFPIVGKGRMKKKVWITATDLYARQTSRLRQSVSANAMRRINDLQPFQRLGTNYQDDPLWQLSELDNAYKHRLLIVVEHKLKRYTVNVKHGSTIIAAGNFAPDIPFKDGAEIGYLPVPDISIADTNISLDGDAMFAIAFAQFSSYRNISVLESLQRLYRYVGDILKEFKTLPEFPQV